MSDNLAAWTEILDQFERALDAADQQMVPASFEPPPGPPPAELVERARAVLSRQQLMMDGVVASRAKVARELAALRRIPQQHSETPLYLDVEG